MIIDIDLDRLPNDADVMPIVEWCEKHIGPNGKKWQGHYDETDRVFRWHFKYEADAILFTLRWS